MSRRPAPRSGPGIFGLSCLGCGLVVAALFMLGLIGVGLNGRRPVTDPNASATTAKGRPAALVQEPDNDDHLAEEARASWLAEARAAKRTELEGMATKAETAATEARAAYTKAYKAGVAFAKQKALKEDAEALEAKAKRAKDAVASADTYEPPPPADHTPVVTVGKVAPGNDRVVHVQGYHRKDGTYVPPYTRRLPR